MLWYHLLIFLLWRRVIGIHIWNISSSSTANIFENDPGGYFVTIEHFTVNIINCHKPKTHTKVRNSLFWLVKVVLAVSHLGFWDVWKSNLLVTNLIRLVTIKYKCRRQYFKFMTISYKMSYRNLAFWLLAIFHNRQFTNGPWGMYHRFSLSILSLVIKIKQACKNLVLSCLWLYNFFQNNWWCKHKQF